LPVRSARFHCPATVLAEFEAGMALMRTLADGRKPKVCTSIVSRLTSTHNVAPPASLRADACNPHITTTTTTTPSPTHQYPLASIQPARRMGRTAAPGSKAATP